MVCTISVIYFWGKLIIVLMCILLRKTDGPILEFLLLIINGCLLVIFSWMKIIIPDRITCDEWIKKWMLENNYLGFSSIDMNSEASYQWWSINKWEWLNTVIQ